MARNFQNVTDRIDYGTSTALNVLGDLSITAWIYINAASSYHFILCKGDSGILNLPYDFHIQNEISPQRMTITRAGATSTGNVFSNSGVTSGVWHHVAVTWDTVPANDVVVFYVDGAAQAPINLASVPTFVTSANGCQVGNRNGSTNSLVQNKKLAWVCLHNVVLKAGEIFQAKNRGWTPRGLVLCAPLYGAGTTEVDLGGARNLGTVTGTTVVGGPPMVGQYGSQLLGRGLWAAAATAAAAGLPPKSRIFKAPKRKFRQKLRTVYT
jgi:hypothetical protein